jgi:hypothetical protein
VKVAVFWVVAPCSLIEIYQHFRGVYCLHHQRPEVVSILASYSGGPAFKSRPGHRLSSEVFPGFSLAIALHVFQLLYRLIFKICTWTWPFRSKHGLQKVTVSCTDVTIDCSCVGSVASCGHTHWWLEAATSLSHIGLPPVTQLINAVCYNRNS